MVAITGQSGSGTSSLLYCPAGVLPVAHGQVRFENRALGDLTDDEISTLRRERFGFVFPYGELLPELTIEENGESTALPLRLAASATSPLLPPPGRCSTGPDSGSCANGARPRWRADRAGASPSHRPSSTGRPSSSRTEPTGSLDSANAPAAQPGRP
ncbi:ATP-binding cassette domain-containing protein [Streptomyces sp. NPDC087659]|uniref:ATP-binding cassette domain-containing protein n=1 Tax=Streptomyces sp. NPDC087659 TaxID=3365801 RepID=UPI0037F213DD